MYVIRSLCQCPVSERSRRCLLEERKNMGQYFCKEEIVSSDLSKISDGGKCLVHLSLSP